MCVRSLARGVGILSLAGGEFDGTYLAGGEADRGLFLLGFQLELSKLHVPVL